MDRRNLLRAAGLAAIGAGFARAYPARIPGSGLAGTQRQLAKVNVSPSRVIRTVVGLRPFRPSGFVVKSQRFRNKTVIHNYGHGRSGVTLSWGTAHLAVEEALRTAKTRYAVIGCGAVGLATARLLQQRGFGVAIYAKDLPPNTTSNIAGAVWDADPTDVAPELRQIYVRAARLSHRYFQQMVGDYYGVHWIESYSENQEDLRRSHGGESSLHDLYPEFSELGRTEHSFPMPSVLRWFTMLIEPPIYLNAVMRDFQLAGGRIVVRDFPDQKAVLALPEPVIINCTGLGAKALFNDPELTPVKGQFTVLIPQPEIDYITDIPGDMVPRKDGILLGSTWEPGVWTLEPNEEAIHRVINRHRHFFDKMK